MSFLSKIVKRDHNKIIFASPSVSGVVLVINFIYQWLIKYVSDVFQFLYNITMTIN